MAAPGGPAPDRARQQGPGENRSQEQSRGSSLGPLSEPKQGSPALGMRFCVFGVEMVIPARATSSVGIRLHKRRGSTF